MTTSVRLDPTHERRLERLAQRTGRTKAYYVREFVSRGLDDLEDYYLADRIAKRVRKGQEQTCSAKQVSRRPFRNPGGVKADSQNCGAELR